MNKIIIQLPKIENQKITYSYEVLGEWNEVFNNSNEFFIEYSCDLSNLPFGVAIVPLLANILPISWVYDAEIVAPICDEDFYNSINDFKQGYIDMYPTMTFGGKLTVEKIEKNIVDKQNGCAAFFSGGVDAFNTLTQHFEEKPSLITLWGADVKLEDVKGFENVENHLRKTATDFGVDYFVVKTSFRKFLNESVLDKKVQQSGDGWWHGFQHGIGIISHSAPLMYVLEKKTVYFASSFTAEGKGKVTCASDPTIDNFVRFCGCNVVHDGYEFNRQMKIHNIILFSKNTGKAIPLRVCWESTGGSNCCNCEKCWRTIMGIYAEGENPHDYGFEYSDEQFSKLSKRLRYSGDKMLGSLRGSLTYKPIQDSMRKNNNKNDLPKSIRWFYDIDINKLGKRPIWMKIYYKFRAIAHRIIK